MKLAIGCPIFEREWCFDQWADSVEGQQWPDGTEVEFHFIYTPSLDDTLGAIYRRLAGEKVSVMLDAEEGYRNEQRGDKQRYEHLARLRNILLGSVDQSGADWFLSWDSDMLLTNGEALFLDKPVVGAQVEMMGEDWLLDSHPEAAHQSWMMWADDDTAFRPQESVLDSPRRVDVVMAVVLISRDAFTRARYSYDPQGEDIGFARSCRDNGVEQWLAPAARAVHLHDRP